MLGEKLSPGTKAGFLKSEKMLRFTLLYIHISVLENVYVNNIVKLWMMLYHNIDIYMTTSATTNVNNTSHRTNRTKMGNNISPGGITSATDHWPNISQ